MTRNLKAASLIAGLGAAAIAIYLLPVADALTEMLRWIDQNRAIAWAVYIAGYVAATVLLIPGSIITIAAGFIFGLPLGTIVVSAGSVIGATASFALGRNFVRGWVEHRIAGMPRFRALDRATQSSGFSIVLLARLSPLFPFNLLNYAFGLTGVRLRDYVFASWIGMLPGTIVYVYVGTLTNDLTFIVAGDVDAGRAGTVLLGVGLIATVLLTAFVTRKATSLLNDKLDSPPTDDSPTDRSERAADASEN